MGGAERTRLLQGQMELVRPHAIRGDYVFKALALFV